jgi:hypothetical protein
MWSNFTHIFFRIIHGMPVLVSSNWAAWLIGVGAFALSQVIVLVRHGWQEMLRRWKENIGIGLISAAAVYAFLFAWSTIWTIYDDHHDVVGRARVVFDEKNNLKTEVEKRDKYIKKLEDRKCPTCLAATKGVAVKEPHQCWFQEIIAGSLPPDSLISTVAAIHCNYRVVAPFCASAKFARSDFKGGNVSIPGGWFAPADSPRKEGDTFTGCISMPSLGADQLVTVTVYGTQKDAVRLLSAEIK